MYRSVLKPLADRMVSAIALAITSPVFLLVALFLAIANGGNPFFIQARPGKNNKIFRLIKFRSMTNERYPDGNLLPDAHRLTAIGKFVRKSSLDEIPQLINVVKGDMSIVGPRPLLVEYLGRYNNQQARRHEVFPGITGWAQVNGRNAVSWDDRLKMDVYYVDHQSFYLDMKILFLTVVKVFKSEGIRGKGSVTMEKFTGKNSSGDI